MTATSFFVAPEDDVFLEVAHISIRGHGGLRAYGEDMAQVAHTPGVESTSLPPSPPVVRMAEARCAICKNAIPAERKRAHPRAVTCSDSCSHKRTTQRQKAYNQRLISSEERRRP